MLNRVSCISLLVGSLIAVDHAAMADESSVEQERRQYLESISAAEKDELRRKQERFEKLPVEEQEKLRSLESTLANDPEGQRLREVMLRYHEWWRSLLSSQRMEIMNAPPEERVEKVKKRLAEQEKQRQEELAMQSIRPQDIDVIRTWMKSIFQRAESKMLALLSAEERESCEKVPEPHRFGKVVGTLVRKNRLENNPTQLDAVMGVTEQDRKDLVPQLSTPAQTAYEGAANDAERRQLVLSWMRWAVWREITRVSPQDVKNFANRPNPRLPDHLRDQIDYLPPHQVRAEFEGFLFREESRKRFGEGPGFPRPPFKGNPPPPPPRDK
jgi:hypothetical protein